MDYMLKTAKLTKFNMDLKELDDEIKETIKYKNIKPTIKKNMDIYEQSTKASTLNEQNIYIIPEFNDELINDLTNEKNIVYNKKHKQETYLNNALFYMLYTTQDRTVKINAYGHKPDNYKYIERRGNIYFGASEWFILFTIEPFNINQFKKLRDIIYYNEA